MAFLVVACSGEPALHATTSGAIAVANLEHQLARTSGGDAAVELLLTQARFLGRHDALLRAEQLVEAEGDSPEALLRRARVYSTLHRFEEALSALDTAEARGAPPSSLERATIAIATGRPEEALPLLEAQRPSYASHSALANAYATLGRFEEADRAYQAARDALQTTLPFPYAWIAFARGVMWSERAGDPARGAPFYEEALAYLPGYVTAAVHLAEIERDQGAPERALQRLSAITTDDPELWALRGELRLALGQRAQGLEEIARARARYEELLARHPLAFAHHAESYREAGQ